jgi:hypothetical protein
MRKKITILMSMLFVLSISQSFAQTTIDFEPAGAGAGYVWTVSENASNPAMAFITNPDMTGGNTSATVAEFTALQAGNPWALCFTDDIGTFTFDATNSTVKIMVWKPTISNVGIKFEMPGGANHEIQIPNTVTNQWEELTFDFSSQIGVSFSRLVIIPDFIGRTQDNTLYLDNVSFSAGGGSTTSNVTFKVDMNSYTGSTANGVFVNGGFNGWCGACNPMTDADGDGVWEITLPLANGAIEYKFTVDGWNDQEMFAGGEPCTLTTGANTNRIKTITQDVTMPAVCWNSCTACGGAGGMVNVTYKVNAALVTTDSAGIFLAGGSLFGVPGDNPMSDADGDDVWEITIAVPQGTAFNYTFTNGNCPSWGCKENIAGLPCADAGNFNDRKSLGIFSDTTILACFGACESDGSCPVPATPINVTFKVDMNGETVDPTGVFLGGDFEGWSGGQVLIDANTDGVWEITMVLNAGQFLQWKFINGAGWASSESFDSTHSACTQDFGGFINRVATLGSSDTTLPTFFYNSCDMSTVNTKSVFTKTELFTIAPTLVTDATIINFNENIIAADKQIRVMNAVGQVVMSETIGQTQQYRLDASNFTNGLYFVVIQSEGFAQTARILVSK